MTSILGITGKAGSGKTTAGKVLLSAKWHQVKFAGPLKFMARVFLLSAGFSPKDAERMIDGDLKEVPIASLGGKTPRHIMQTLGTEWGRDLISPTLWVDIARQECLTWMKAGRSVFVDDVRFENEAEMIRDLGGTILQIVGRETSVGGHVSEGGVTPDIVCRNDGTIDELHGFMRYVFLQDEEPSQWSIEARH